MYKFRDYTEYDYCDEREITKLLLYRKIVRVEGDTLVLDNGVQLEVIPNEGCGGCSNGWYYLTELNKCDNAITKVEFCTDDDFEDDGYNDTSYKIFVYAENEKTKILQVDGSDGNGWYGSGYSIRVRGGS